jgi:hypothetical protein
LKKRLAFYGLVHLFSRNLFIFKTDIAVSPITFKIQVGVAVDGDSCAIRFISLIMRSSAMRISAFVMVSVFLGVLKNITNGHLSRSHNRTFVVQNHASQFENIRSNKREIGARLKKPADSPAGFSPIGSR